MFLFIFSVTIVQFYHLPSYFRFAKNVRQAQISSMIIFILLLPMMEISGAMFSSSSFSQLNLIQFLMKDIHLFGQILLTGLIILSGVNINNINLYGSYLNMKFLIPVEQYGYLLIIFLGSAGVFLSYFDFLQHFETVLKTISFLIAINAMIYVGFVLKRGVHGSQFK